MTTSFKVGYAGFDLAPKPGRLVEMEVLKLLFYSPLPIADYSFISRSSKYNSVFPVIYNRHTKMEIWIYAGIS